MKHLCYLSALICLLLTTNLYAAEEAKLESHLEPLRPLLDKTWKGPFKRSTPDKPVVDVMRWERALNGKAVRVLHSVNDGNYGGRDDLHVGREEAGGRISLFHDRRVHDCGHGKF